MYNHQEIEKKWQNYWRENNTFKTSNTSLRPKYYVLDMFPYPSGAGLHVGHPEWYTANDIIARYKHAKWHNVLHPMGWDAFGLPAENYAIKTGVHPRITTDQNIATFKRQIQELGFSYDWEREIDTTDPEYYKWTQWIFLKLFEEGLAYEQDLPINYCPSCKTGLANEEVLWDFSCERCGTQVEKKKIRQWVLAITKYAERLLADVDDLDWPEGIKDMQRNWIWKSEGCEFELFGMTYAVIAPDHPDVHDFIESSHSDDVLAYIKKANNQSDQDRTADDKEKTWVFTGSYVINPYNGEQVPLWIADYVLGSYGTWAVMAVPAHDVRDFEFAKKFNLDVKCVIQPHFDETERWDNDLEDPKEVKALRWDIYFTAKDSHLINSWKYDGLSFQQAIDTFMEIAESEWFGHKKINYKLRDWLFSRQRYWGEPIPVVHCEECGIVGEKEENLPILLPDTENFEPSWDGTSPLTLIEDFVNCECPQCGWPAKRETNTMPQWWGSCWYYLRFMDNTNSENLVGSEIEKYWGQVDSYVGWAEHAVLHLLYARFWHKFLFDIWVVSTSEPFYRLRNQGMILGMSYRNAKGKLIADDMVEEKEWKYFDTETGDELEKIPAKMSKSLKNVINPDDIVQQYGADTLRMYEMYMADFKDAAPWDPSSIVWVRRFLDKFHAMMSWENPRPAKSDDEAMKALHKTIKKVGIDIENYKFNTAIAQMMILLNTGEPQDAEKNVEWKRAFIQILHPFAPHMAEECWEMVAPEKQEVLKVYFATGNTSKIERAHKLLSKLNPDAVVEKYPEIIEIEETARTPLECALQKLEVYKWKDIDAPIAVADTAVYFESADFDFEPTKVKRTALELAGKKESDLSIEEVAELMIAYYQERAREAGWSLDYYYVDSWAVLYPNGEVKTIEYRREYTLTDVREWELKPYFPMANLYVSKYTGKRHHESTQEDFFMEFAGQMEAVKELFGYQDSSIFFTDWPEYDEAMTVDNEVTIWVQVLGKLRGEITISKDEDKSVVLEKAKTLPDVMKWTQGKDIIKEIYVPGKIVNLVVK